MKKKLIYTCTLFSCLLFLMGCADDLVSGIFRGDGVQLTINLNVPGESSAATRAIKTRVGGSNVFDNELDSATYYQRFIADDDLYILVFENTGSSQSEEWTLLAVPTITSISGYNGDETREITAMMSRVSGSKTLLVDVVANLAENGVTVPDFSNMIGSSRETIYSTIGTFAYPENSESNPYGVWSLSTTDDNGNETAHRYLPMWGQSSNSSTGGGRMTYTVDGNTTELEVHCGLYRSVAKMGLLVDEGCSTFQPTELYVYYINNEGTFVSLPVESGDGANWSPSINVQYTLPEVPSSATARDIAYPLVYKMSNPISAGNSYLNQIYVTEADNKNNSTNPVCLVVGGYYSGGSYDGEGLDYNHINYYRIDLESLTTDSESGTTTSGAFDVIRNHSYLFNILNANNPGTSDPDPRSAAAGLEVEVLEYVDVPMHGINSQYTLNVNQSLFAFEGATTTVGELIISTDGEGWELVTEWTIEDENGNEITGSTDSWAKVTDTSEGAHTDDGDIVTIEPSANVNTTDIRNTSFYIKCGQIMKRIDVVQDNTETGNSYIVTEEGSYDIKIDIRGNSNTRAWTDDTGNNYEDIDFQMTGSISDVAYAAIIWETADGFVTIPDPYEISESGCLAYEVNNISLDSFGDWSGKVFDPGNGANALIGVYDSNNNLLWSYHIWGLGDYANGDLTEEWQTGSDGSAYYSYMDRNLGAYSNLPGSKSFGLLYQWGRKDPFIGAYREAGTNGTYERDFRQVRKQYTVHYEQKNSRTYVWGNYNDEGVEEDQDVKYAIANPTTILDEGLLNTDHSATGSEAQEQAKGLWGTSSYTADVSETGNKTMYDPCPPGYRVPSLNALTIYDGYNDLWESSQAQHSSFSSRFVPVPESTDEDDQDYRTGNGHSADFVSGAPFYGFWLDYANDFGFNSSATETQEEGPGGTTNTTWALGANAYGVGYYSSTTVANGTYGWITGYLNSKPASVTWIPMAGIYNGSMESFGRAGLTDLDPDLNGPGGQGGQGGQGTFPVRRKAKASSTGYLPASSLEVTSVLWANSPTANNENYPGGLLIHGTEGAYAPHQTDGTPFWYSSGTATSATGTPGSVDTEGKGYWTTDDSGSSTTASGWWTGSVDAGKSSMDGSIQSGQWNGDSQITSYDSWDDENGFNQSGRHFHSFIESNASVYANPSYAASVRCIRDKDAIVHTNDSIFNSDGTAYEGETLYLYEYGTSSTPGPGPGQTVQDEITLYISYIEEWEVVSPGAKWVSINPSSGTTSESSGTIDVITITYIEQYLPTDASESNPAEATITIKTARGETFSIVVQYVGGTRSR